MRGLNESIVEDEERLEELERRVAELARQVAAVNSAPSLETNCSLAKELHNFKVSLMSDAQSYEEAKYLGYIVGLLAFMLDPSIQGDASAFDALGGINKGALDICVTNLLNADESRKPILARQCRNLHRLLCPYTVLR